MRGRGGYARLGLDRVDHREAVAIRQIGEVLVIGDRLDTAERRCELLPRGDLRVEHGVEVIETGLVGRRSVGIDAGETLGDRLRHLLAAHRIHAEVRIAERVQLALRAVLAGRHLERLDVHRGVDVPGARRQDLRVARHFEQRGQEGVLETEPVHDDRVGAIELRDEARLHRDLVRILVALRDRDHLDAVAADLARHVGDVGRRRDHPQHRRRGIRHAEQSGRRARERA